MCLVRIRLAVFSGVSPLVRGGQEAGRSMAIATSCGDTGYSAGDGGAGGSTAEVVMNHEHWKLTAHRRGP